MDRSLTKHRIISDACRDCRKTLLLYRDNTSHPLNMNGCFDHAITCHQCYNWATRNGFHELIKKYGDDKLKQLQCPSARARLAVIILVVFALVMLCLWFLSRGRGK